MKRFLQITSLAMVCAIYACTGHIGGPVNYYFDPVEGDDLHAGTSEDQPFRSLEKIRGLRLGPGDSVLLKSGSTFTDQLFISCRGAPGSPVVVGKYGGKSRPHIKGDATRMQAVHVYNSEHIVIRDLEISNRGRHPVAALKGLLVELENYGTGKDITIDNLFVHDVYGTLLVEEDDGGNAIHLKNYNDAEQDTIASRFDGLIVQNCLIKDCQRNGIRMRGNWERHRWFPSLNVVIRNNVLDGVPGDGIVPVACESPLIEYNVMKNCPPTLPPSEACDGIWPWSCDNAVVQYNVVSNHRSKVDGYGFDSDWNSTNSLFQYNLSFSNDGGFLLVCNSGGWPPEWSTGNTGTVVRYNISINDGLRDHVTHDNKFFSPVIHFTGPISHTFIEKNLFCVFKKPKQEMDRTLFSLTDWSGDPDSTYIRNNYIFVEEPTLALDAGASTNNFVENNLFVGDLRIPGNGFVPYDGKFDSNMWCDENDENWTRLIGFVKDKTLPLNDRDVAVLEIIGYLQ